MLAAVPKEANYVFGLGFALVNFGRYEEALEAYEEALEIKTEFAEAWYNRAFVYSLMNLKNEALADLKRAVELDPSYREKRKAIKILKSCGKIEISRK